MAMVLGRLAFARLPLPFKAARQARSMAGKVHATNRKINVSHIMVGTDKASVLDSAEQEIAAGTPFAQVAEKYSECASKRKGGQMGWLEKGVYFPTFESVAFQTPVGQLARATTPRGHHLLIVTAEREEANIEQMTVQELQELLRNPALLEDVQLVDVRESWEADLARLPGFKLFPLSQFQAWKDTITDVLDIDRQTVVLCHHGVRSMNMSSYLIQQGFTQVYNVTGGIDAYSRGADPNVPTY